MLRLVLVVAASMAICADVYAQPEELLLHVNGTIDLDSVDPALGEVIGDTQESWSIEVGLLRDGVATYDVETDALVGRFGSASSGPASALLFPGNALIAFNGGLNDRLSGLGFVFFESYEGIDFRIATHIDGFGVVDVVGIAAVEIGTLAEGVPITDFAVDVRRMEIQNVLGRTLAVGTIDSFEYTSIPGPGVVAAIGVCGGVMSRRVRRGRRLS
ncbi:MAG: hypothetical protein AAGI53_15080 [Planctomycetota bacterium]